MQDLSFGGIGPVPPCEWVTSMQHKESFLGIELSSILINSFWLSGFTSQRV